MSVHGQREELALLLPQLNLEVVGLSKRPRQADAALPRPQSDLTDTTKTTQIGTLSNDSRRQKALVLVAGAVWCRHRLAGAFGPQLQIGIAHVAGEIVQSC